MRLVFMVSVSADQLHPVKIYQLEHIVMQPITFAHVRPQSHPVLVRLIPVLMAFVCVDQMQNAVALLFAEMEIALQVSIDRYRLHIEYF